ncbi:EKC/KEOPS complex subunit TPRKB [Hydra vulgaris]|uniref:EKC/KEOPS complex subunit TPRKB n=1 Tax=Hydra vulgaris TaxID=6087 RepID=A0ABM4CCJ5_HYDVU
MITELQQSYKVDLYPDYLIQVALCNNVTNTSYLREKCLKGEFSCAILSTTLIPDIFPVLISCNKTIHCFTESSMKTRNIHTEIMLNLSSSNSIKDSLKLFGANDTDSTLLFVMVSKKEVQDKFCEILNEIKGNFVAVSELSNMCDYNSTKKHYKISDDELSASNFKNAISMRIASKDV